MITAEEFIQRNLTPYTIDWDGDSKTGYMADLEREPILIDFGTPTEDAMAQADVVSSELRAPSLDGEHVVILDIDQHAWLIPSSTEGHSHLYIDVQVPHEGYMALVALLGHLGIIEKGYAMASVRRGHTDLRPPWVTKGSEPGRTRPKPKTETCSHCGAEATVLS